MKPPKRKHRLDSAIKAIEEQYTHALLNDREEQAETLFGIINQLTEVRAADLRADRRAWAAS